MSLELNWSHLIICVINSRLSEVKICEVSHWWLRKLCEHTYGWRLSAVLSASAAESAEQLALANYSFVSRISSSWFWSSDMTTTVILKGLRYFCHLLMLIHKPKQNPGNVYYVITWCALSTHNAIRPRAPPWVLNLTRRFNKLKK